MFARIASLVLLLALGGVPLASHAATVRAASTACGGLWSQGSTWDTGSPPQANDFVQIDEGCTVVYDLATSPPLAEINLEGSLVFARNKTTQLTVSLLLVEPTGRLEIGTAALPLPAAYKATIRLIDLPAQTHTHLHGQPLIAPALHAHGGTVTLAGAPKTPTWTLLAKDVAAGATALTLAETPQGWRVGDTLVLSGTTPTRGLGHERTQVSSTVCWRDTHDQACIDSAGWTTETRTITAISGAVVTVTPPLTYAHLGTAPQQAAVGNLTRNVVITSADPTGRRGHVMVAHGFVVPDATPLPPLTNLVTASLSHVEFAHLGRPEPGIYPMHFHRLGNAGGTSVLVGSSIHHSQNLCVRVHTTNFLAVHNNVCFDAVGHGFATEDGTEMFNTFHHNLAVRTKAAVVKTNPNDPTDLNEGSGFWLNNAHNVVTENYAGEPDAWGFQLDPRTTGGNVPVGVMITPVDWQGLPQVPQLVTSLPILIFRGNRTQGGFLGTTEVLNLDTSTTNVIETLQGYGARQGLQVFGTPYRVRGASLERGFGSYAPGNFPIMLLSRLPQIVLEHSTVGTSGQGYQFRGSLAFLDNTIGMLETQGFGNPMLWVLNRGTRPGDIMIDVTGYPLDSTTQQEIYLFDYDGVGQHRKLIPEGRVAIDTLPYQPSADFGTQGNDRFGFQEARFTGLAQGPPLRLPLRILAGSDHRYAGRDVIDAQGRRWRLDLPYRASVEGYLLPRYGYGYRPSHFTATSDPTALYGSVASGRPGDPLQYLLDVPNGAYHVDLHFVERWQSGAYPFQGTPNPAWGVGTRVFAVLAEGVTVLPALDVFKEAGGVGIPLVKSLTTTVSDGQLLLEFVGHGMVSGLAVCRLDQAVNGLCRP